MTEILLNYVTEGPIYYTLTMVQEMACWKKDDNILHIITRIISYVFQS